MTTNFKSFSVKGPVHCHSQFRRFEPLLVTNSGEQERLIMGICKNCQGPQMGLQPGGPNDSITLINLDYVFNDDLYY